MDELVKGSGMDGMSPSWQDLIFLYGIRFSTFQSV